MCRLKVKWPYGGKNKSCSTFPLCATFKPLPRPSLPFDTTTPIHRHEINTLLEILTCSTFWPSQYDSILPHQTIRGQSFALGEVAAVSVPRHEGKPQDGEDPEEGVFLDEAGGGNEGDGDELEPETGVDPAEDDGYSPDPAVGVGEDGLFARAFEVDMLNNSEDGLQKDDGNGSCESDDDMGFDGSAGPEEVQVIVGHADADTEARHDKGPAGDLDGDVDSCYDGGTAEREV